MAKLLLNKKPFDYKLINCLIVIQAAGLGKLSVPVKDNNYDFIYLVNDKELYKILKFVCVSISIGHRGQ